MSEIKVTFAELEGAGTNITSAAGKVQNSLDDLKQYLQPLVASWTGAAQESYLSLQGQWDRSAADLQQVLQSIGIAVHHANENYQQGERTNTSRFAQ